MNKYLNFYEKYKISPVVQKIDNFQEHVRRRSNLYRQLSLPSIIFKDKNILEIGPAGGYNALVTRTYNPKSYTFIEPNSTGFKELIHNFKNFDDNLFYYNCMLEEFQSESKYDIIICEGLIPGLENKKDFINKIISLLDDNGVLIITTADEISTFFEITRKYMADILVKDTRNIKDKVDTLIETFSTHLDTLDGMTRSYSDWCLDNLIGNAILEHTFSIKDALDLLGEQFYILGTSPNIFQNYTWYKELPTKTLEYNKLYKKQFQVLWHNFLDYRHINRERIEIKNEKLSNYCFSFLDAVKKSSPPNEIISIVKKIQKNLFNEVDKETLLSIDEIIKILEIGITSINIQNMDSFTSAFGRGQSYISFQKSDF